MKRREILGLGTVAAFGMLGSKGNAEPTSEATQGNRENKNRPKLLIFDVNETLLNLEPLQKSVAAALGGKKELVELWFTTLLQYSLVETVSGSYRKFGEIGAAVLTMVAKNHGIALTLEEAKQAIKPIASLPAHDDVKPGLQALKDAGYRMITLTNSPQEGVDAQIENAGLTQFFERRLTVGEIEIYKPDLRSYRWAVDQMGVPVEDCMLIAAHGWDITGALRAGMRAAFLARPGKALYPLSPEPELIAQDLAVAAEKLAALVMKR